jgi:hypothetical protein
MPQVVPSDSRAWILRIPLPRLGVPHFIRRTAMYWWDGWRSIGAAMGRRGIR